MARWEEAFAGAGLGLLVGLLVGLSVASVVGGVVGAIAAGLAAFLGLAPKVIADRTLRIGAFGLACAAGVLVGLTVRTGSWGLAPSVRADVKAWTDAGYAPLEARSLVAYQRLGIRPSGDEAAPIPKPGARDPVLFSSAADLCARIVRLSDAEKLSVLGGKTAGATGAALAAAVTAAPAEAQHTVLQGAIRSLCGQVD